MRIFYIPTWLMLISYFIGWPIIQLSIAYLINKLDAKYFKADNFFLRSRKWEGHLYKKILKVHKWKHLLPDGAATYKNGFRKKNLQNGESEYIKTFIIETGRAEIMHWLEILPFWVFGFWSPPFVIWIMLGYALIVNLPCIIAQRYNRPRLVRMEMKKGVHG